MTGLDSLTRLAYSAELGWRFEPDDPVINQFWIGLVPWMDLRLTWRNEIKATTWLLEREENVSACGACRDY
jgi:hypothetical protein